MAVILAGTGNVLAFLQTPVAARPATLKVEVPSNTLSLNQSVSFIYHSLKQFPSNTLVMTQSAKANFVLAAHASNYLPMQDRGVKVIEVSATNFISYAQNGVRNQTGSASNNLSISQQVDYGRGLTQLIVFSQSVIPHIVKIEGLPQVLNLKQEVAVYIEGKTFFLGVELVSTAIYDPALVQISEQPLVTLPATMSFGGKTLTFKNIQYDNKDTVEHTRINRRSRGNNLIVYRDPRWPKTETLNFKVYNMCAKLADDLLLFLGNSLAQPVEYVDYEGVKWTGFITNPELEVSQSIADLPGSCGGYEAEIHFQGVQHA